jgi:hypothetical protein
MIKFMDINKFIESNLAEEITKSSIWISGEKTGFEKQPRLNSTKIPTGTRFAYIFD